MSTQIDLNDPHSIKVFDLNMAKAYYTCVFDAELAGKSCEKSCDIKIGSRLYHLVRDKTGAKCELRHKAVVQDVDVSIARIATRGGKIIARAERNEAGVRQGCVQDPFGHQWLVQTGD